MPDLTVALPTCNGARHLREALLSVLQQNVPFDILISDDRSDDATIAIIRETAGDRARITVNPERLGLGGNWNQCVALSRSPFVAVFHQDDVMRPGHLQAHLEAFTTMPDLGLVASAADVIDADGHEVPSSIVGRGCCGPNDRVYPTYGFIRALSVENPLRCSAVTLNKSAHAEVGGFDPTYRYVVDWDYWLRVAQIRPIAWLGKPTVAIRWHFASETHRFATGTADLDETARLLDSLYQRDKTLGSRRPADRRLSRAFLNRVYVALKAGNPRLARRCLGRSIQLDPMIVGTVACDPRLMARLLAFGWRSGSSE